MGGYSNVSGRPTPPPVGGSGSSSSGSSRPAPPSSGSSSRPAPPSSGSYGRDDYRPAPPSTGGYTPSRPTPPSTGGGYTPSRPTPPSTGGGYTPSRPTPPSTGGGYTPSRPTPPSTDPYYPSRPTPPSTGGGYYPSRPTPPSTDPYYPSRPPVDPYYPGGNYYPSPVPRYYPFPVPSYPGRYYGEIPTLPYASHPSHIADNFLRARADLRRLYNATAMTSREYGMLERQLTSQAVDQLLLDARGYSLDSRLSALHAIYLNSEMTRSEYTRIQEDLYAQSYRY